MRAVTNDEDDPAVRTRSPALARLEDLTRGALIRGIVPDAAVHIVDAEWLGPDVVDVTVGMQRRRNPSC